MEEADQLADRISVVDQGRVVAEGTSDELKSKIGGDRVEVVVRDAADLAEAARLVGHATAAPPEIDADVRKVSAPVTDRVAALAEVMRTLQAARITVEDVGVRRPTLDEAFLQITGHRVGA
jgi:ABC-2 type transport system ATP-binding protein